MPFAIFSVAVLMTADAPGHDAATVTNVSEVLLMNCIDTEFKIVAETDAYLVAECNGDWKPFQSTRTEFDVRKELRNCGIAAEPFSTTGGVGANPIWKSGEDDFPLLESGKRSALNSQIQGMCTKDVNGVRKTYVILFKAA